jgi:hypothetical protein
MSVGIPYSPNFSTGSDLISPIEKGVPMKGSKSLIAITIATTLAITPSAIAAPKTTLKAAGRVVTTVVNTILSGTSIPTKAIGIDGDFYIDTKNANLYGPKTKGVWKIATSLKQTDTKSVTTVVGEQGGIGATGATGPQGDKGDKGATGNNGVAGAVGLSGATGAKGNDGATGATGFSGATGSIGATGAVGATGAKGDTGLTGATGATGAAGINGTNGVDGAAGLQGTPGAAGAKGDTGTAGAVGSTGSAGAKGDTGTAGADGVSNAKLNSLPNIALNTTSGGANGASNFFTVTELGNYTFQVLISGAVSKTDDLNFTAEIISGGTAIDNQFVVSSAAVISTGGTPGRRYSIVATAVVSNVAPGTIFGVRISLDTAAATGFTIYFSGRALINKVGSIG